MSNNLESLLTKIQQNADLFDRQNKRSDLQYKSIESLILAYGRPFIKKVKSSFKAEPKSCFKNCFQALWKYQNFSYCEGYATDDELPLALSHAWLVNEKGEVIDPTWVGKQHKGSTYFGVVFNREYVMEMAEKLRCYGILDNDYMNEHQLLHQGFPPHALHSKFHSVMEGE